MTHVNRHEPSDTRELENLLAYTEKEREREKANVTTPAPDNIKCCTEDKYIATRGRERERKDVIETVLRNVEIGKRQITRMNITCE